MDRLKGKVALISGGARGQGAAETKLFVNEGARVVIGDVLDGEARNLAEEVNRHAGSRVALPLHLDVTRAADWRTAVDACEREFGGLDILVNNAGATKRGDFFALSDADWQDGFALKFFAHVRLARAAWPLLKKRRGSLITIGGTSGRKPQASFTIGSSVNAACAAFSKALADLGKQDGVQVNCIHPSLVDTDRQGGRIAAEMKRTGQPEAVIRAQFCAESGITRFGTTQDVAGLACFIVSKNGSWLHGATIDLDGGEISVL